MRRPKNFSREEVLEKAVPVFWKRGFSDTSVQDLERGHSELYLVIPIREWDEADAVPIGAVRR